ncbi:hypothetical protein, conserved [Leishmania donovani]|uniref:Uncharacterized protein n=1 Tax=Leishmania donovani TaxID=5661 RepID=E9BR26_LEIDO|nr:hypothetical protein, conserved [Leishmania donovani]AYU82583.1 hypothetical protein LdCL_340030500 [Leishmania donovani]CBZ37705.1 hypothetical protein, conserved [Leishmania donovani]
MTQQDGGPGPSSAVSPNGDVSDVTHSTAYVVLNALIDEGQISEERADYLKRKFKELHSRVLAIYRRDNTLLKHARQLRSRLEVERQRIYTFGDAAKKDDEVIQALKRNLMEHERDLAAALERDSVLQVEVLEYDRRKQHLILEREDAIAAEEARIRPKMESMQAEITEMGTHIKELAADLVRCQAEKDELVKEEAQKKEEIANFATTLAQARKQLQNVQSDPERAKKQLDLVQGSLVGAQRELSSTEEKVLAQAERIQSMELQRNSRAEDHEAAKKRLQTLRAEMDAKRKTLATMNTSLEVEVETRQATQERVAELDQLVLSTKIALQQEQDGVDRIEREREKCMRIFSTLERDMEDSRREEESLREQIGLLHRELEQVTRATAHVEKEIQAHRKDAEVRTKKLLFEQAKSKEFVKKAEQVLAEIREAEETIAVKAKQEDVKRRELAAIAVKRQEFSRASAREETRVYLAQCELQMREVLVKEAQRRHSELEKRLGKAIDLFQRVKQERAQKATQIQTIAQAMAQVAEKTKLLEKELSVLTRESALKDQEIAKAKFQLHELTHLCANLRLEKNRQRKQMEKAADSEREVKAQVRRLNTDIAATEDTMADLRRAYAAAIENRNQAGIQLIDRNDEAALLAARIKAQELAIAEGTRMTNDRANEVRMLKTKLGTLLHDIEACQHSIPKVSQMELELTRLREEIETEQWRTQVLEDDITDPKNPHRWNRVPLVLPGNVALPAASEAQATAAAAAMCTQADSAPAALSASSSPGDAGHADKSGGDARAAPAPALVGGPSEQYVCLQARCQELEARVQKLNAKLREKNLILEEVTELAERVGDQADAGKECTLALAQQVNKYHSSIRHKSRQMMATIAELSLFQASSIQLQQEVQRLESVVEEAEERLEAGEAPYAEAELHYERERQCQQRYVAARQRQRDAAKESETSLGMQMVATTAVPRPNAYVPQDDDLGLPRPFGPFAPFKSASAPRVAFNPPRAEASLPSGAQGPSPAPRSMEAVRGSSVPLSAPSSPPGTSAGIPFKACGPSTPPPLPTATAAAVTTTDATSFSSPVPKRRQ